MSNPPSVPIPITVFTGFLGAGKTTIILSLIARLPKNYKVVLLKNEFGDVEVDSELARASNIEVTEMLNGCMCCVLVGQMKNALIEIRDKQHPDRIIIETSGSAFPAPIAWQIRELEQAQEGFTLDAIITVVDCVNFRGYEDTSYTAKMQAKYTDVVVLNKHELVSERELDTVLDHVYTLNEDTPKLKSEGTNGVSPDLVFGLDTKLFSLADREDQVKEWDGRMDRGHHYREVDLCTVMWPPLAGGACKGDHEHGEHCGGGHVGGDAISSTKPSLKREELDVFLASLSKDDVYRVKGLVRLDGTLYVLNWAFGRYTLTEVAARNGEDVEVRVTVMGQGLRSYVRRIGDGFGVGEGVKFVAADPRS